LQVHAAAYIVTWKYPKSEPTSRQQLLKAYKQRNNSFVVTYRRRKLALRTQNPKCVDDNAAAVADNKNAEMTPYIRCFEVIESFEKDHQNDDSLHKTAFIMGSFVRFTILAHKVR